MLKIRLLPLVDRSRSQAALWSLLCLGTLLAPAGANPLLQPQDRLAICGDAMAANLTYAPYIEDYLLACEPVPGTKVAEFGWSAATARDFTNRLETDLVPFQPTVVVTCFGMDDGRYQAPDATIAADYRKAQTALVQALKQRGVRTIVVGSPMCVDPLTYRRGPDQAATYNKTLAAFAAIDREVAAQERVVYADVFGATMSAMLAAKQRYGPSYVFELNENQPADQCNLVIAATLLKTLGCAGNIGTITADFGAHTATAAPGQKVLSFNDKTMTVESTRYPFSFVGHPTTEKPYDASEKRLFFDERLNRYLLVVQHLPSTRAKVIWHDQMYDSHDFSAAELATGINLATEYRDSPFNGHFENVNGGVLDQQQQERISGAAFVQTKVEDMAGKALRDAAFQKAVAALVPVTHTIRIQPLAPDDPRPRGPLNVIVDTDMSGDCDDAGAVALLNSFMNQGEARLIACVVNGRDVDLSSGAAVQAINAYYGHPKVPIGANHGEAWIGPTHSAYTLPVHQHFNPDFPTDDKLPAGVDVYRQALAAAPDGSVVIVSIGLMENLKDLAQSKPDAVSPLAGLELIRRKVRRLVIMSNTNGHDGLVIDHWPTPILFTFDVGSYISTGKSLAATPESNPVRFIYNLFGANDHHTALANGRQSWDLTAAWLGVRGAGKLWDVSYGGYFKVDPQTGASQWVNGPATNQNYVMFRMPVPEVEKLLETELSRPPTGLALTRNQNSP